MTGRTVSRAWASGIAAGACVYLFLDSFRIGHHPIGDGIIFGAVVVGILLRRDEE